MAFPLNLKWGHQSITELHALATLPLKKSESFLLRQIRREEEVEEEEEKEEELGEKHVEEGKQGRGSRLNNNFPIQCNIDSLCVGG